MVALPPPCLHDSRRIFKSCWRYDERATWTSILIRLDSVERPATDGSGDEEHLREGDAIQLQVHERDLLTRSFQTVAWYDTPTARGNQLT